MKKQIGHALLETALALPILLGLIVAAVDVNHFLRSQHALQESVRTALRCSYVVNGECITAEAQPVSALYEAYRGVAEIEQAVDYYRFSFRDKYIEGPELAATGFTARVFSDVNFHYNYFQNSALRKFFPGTGFTSAQTIPVLNGYPYVSGSGPDNINIQWRDSGGDYAVTRTASPGQNIEVDNTGALVTSWHTLANFQFPEAGSRFQLDPETMKRSINFGHRSALHQPGSGNLPGVAVDGGADLQAAPNPETISSDMQNHPFLGHHFQGVLHVQGNSSGSTLYTGGRVELRVIEQRQRVSGGSWQRNVDLGGRYYSRTPGMNGASLYPRGVLLNHVHRDLADADEFGLYHGAVAIRPGSTYIIQVRLNADPAGGIKPDGSLNPSGTFTWNSEAVSLYLPETSNFESDAEQFNCQEGLTPSQATYSPELCTSSQAIPADIVVLHTDQAPLDIEQVSLPNSGTDNIDFAGSLSAALGEVITSQELELDWEHVAIETRSTLLSALCPSNNGMASIDGVEVLRGNSTALIECPAPAAESYQLPADSTLDLEFVHRIVDKPVNVSPLPRWKQEECGNSSLPLHLIPAAVERYGTWRVNSVLPVGQVPHYFGADTDPDDMILTEQFNCSDFSVRLGSVRPNAEDRQNLSASAFTLNSHPGPYCEQELMTIVRAEAINELGYDDRAFIITEQHYAHSQEIADGAHSFPSACTHIRATIVGLENPEKLDGTFYSHELPPEACTIPGVHCSYSFAGILPSSDNGFEVQTAAAREMGLTELQVLNPKAKVFENCSGANCFDMTVEQIEGSEDLIRARADGTISSRILLGREIPISYEETARWEGYFAR